nr:zinc finger, CCHC-type [Tanacetum cinerariifolium]
MAGNTVKEMTTNFGKLDKFEGHDFRRWQKKMHFLLTTLKVIYVLTTPMPKLLEDATVEAIRIREKWENDDYICKSHILNGMSGSLFDVYTNVESAKELWDSLESKYMAEDSSSKKFLSLSVEDVREKIYSNPFFDEEIIPMEIDPHSFNVESYLIGSMPNHDSSIIISSKIDFLFDEFAGELTLLKSFLPGIDKTDCYPEKEIRLTKRLLYDNSSPRDEHLNTISAMESDEFIKSCVENLVPNPSESEGKNGCDVPAGFTTFSNALFDADYDSDSSDDQSLPDEDVPEKIFSNPLFDEEIIPMEIDPHSFNAESVLIKSTLNNDSSIIIPSKIDSLLDEFAGELILLKSIPPGIDKTDCHPEEETHFTKRLLYDNSSPHPPKEFVFDNSTADIKSFSPSPILIKDSDSHMEEIDLSLNPVEPNSKDFAKDVVEIISPTKEPQVLTVLPTHPTLQLNLKFQPSSESLFAYVVWIFLPFLVYSVVPCYLLSLRNEDIIFDPGICKSTFSKPDISHRCGIIKTFNTHRSHLNTFSMMFNGQNNPPLDVLLFHFYPP